MTDKEINKLMMETEETLKKMGYGSDIDIYEEDNELVVNIEYNPVDGECDFIEFTMDIDEPNALDYILERFEDNLETWKDNHSEN